MTTTNTTNSTVIGVFPSYDQANNAIDGLRQARFSYDRIRLVQHGTGGFFDTLKGMFTGQASMASNTPDVLTKMGMPDYEAQRYQSELDANRVLLLMNADDRPEEAFNIMRQSGAFDLTLRLRAAVPDGSAETPAQAAAYANTPQEAYNEAPAQAAYANTPQGAYNQNPVPTTPYANTPQAAPYPAPEQVAPYANTSQEAYNETPAQAAPYANASQEEYNQTPGQAAYADNAREEYTDPRLAAHHDRAYEEEPARANAASYEAEQETPQNIEDEDTIKKDQAV